MAFVYHIHFLESFIRVPIHAWYITLLMVRKVMHPVR